MFITIDFAKKKVTREKLQTFSRYFCVFNKNNFRKLCYKRTSFYSQLFFIGLSFCSYSYRGKVVKIVSFFIMYKIVRNKNFLCLVPTLSVNKPYFLVSTESTESRSLHSQNNPLFKLRFEKFWETNDYHCNYMQIVCPTFSLKCEMHQSTFTCRCHLINCIKIEINL